MGNNQGKKVIWTCLTAVALACTAAPALAMDCSDKARTDPDLMTADIALARPVGIAATVAGFAVFLVSSPFSALGGNTDQAWDSLVAAPATYTFKRPLGDFECDPPEGSTGKVALPETSSPGH